MTTKSSKQPIISLDNVTSSCERQETLDIAGKNIGNYLNDWCQRKSGKIDMDQQITKLQNPTSTASCLGVGGYWKIDFSNHILTFHSSGIAKR